MQVTEIFPYVFKGLEWEDIMNKFEKRIPKPLFVRANDYKRISTGNYIVRRNEFNAAIYVMGKANRKLSTKVEVDHALKMGKLVACWGGKFFLYTRVKPDDGREVLKEVWEFDEKRGIPRPEVSTYDKESFDI